MLCHDLHYLGSNAVTTSHLLAMGMLQLLDCQLTFSANGSVTGQQSTSISRGAEFFIEAILVDSLTHIMKHLVILLVHPFCVLH